MRERAVFRLAKPVPSNAEGTETGDIGFIVAAAPDVHRDSQAENRSLEARSSFQTEPKVHRLERAGKSFVEFALYAVCAPAHGRILDAVNPLLLAHTQIDLALFKTKPVAWRHFEYYSLIKDPGFW